MQGKQAHTGKNRWRASSWAKFSHRADRLVFNWEVRESLYRHLSAQVSNGHAVEEALEKFRARLKRRKRITSDKIIGDVTRRMRDGSTLAAALEPWIPTDELSIVSSGELAGRLPPALELLIESKRRVMAVQQALRSAVTTPAIYLAALYAFIWAIGRYVVPNLSGILPYERTDGLVRLLFDLGHLVSTPWAVLPIILMVATVLVLLYALPRWTGRYRIFAERFALFAYYRDVAGYTWLMGFTALLAAGMTDVAILKFQEQHATPWLQERLKALWWRMDNGASLSDALLAAGRGRTPPFGFPNPDVVDDIASLAGFSDFPERITKVASHWANDLQLEMTVMARRVGIYSEIAIYGVIGVLVIAINAMSSQLSRIG